MNAFHFEFKINMTLQKKTWTFVFMCEYIFPISNMSGSGRVFTIIMTLSLQFCLYVWIFFFLSTKHWKNTQGWTSLLSCFLRLRVTLTPAVPRPCTWGKVWV